MRDAQAPHPVISWGIDVTDDCNMAVIQLHALDLDSKEVATYALDPIAMELSTVRQLHRVLGELVQHMEKGGPGSSRNN